jgi:maleate isomerase
MTDIAIGTITPSSNRAVERTLAAIMPLFPGVDSCIARITYHGPGIGQPKDGYDVETYRHAASQLGHAAVGVVCWNGTRGAALGLDADRALCATMAQAACCKATTAALATMTLLDRFGATRLGFVTPGDVDQAREAAAGLGRPMAGARTLGLKDNLAAAAVEPARIADLARDLAREANPDAILLWSTNLSGWETMAPLEAELGIPVLDSAAVGVWACLHAMGIDMAPAARLGRIFAQRG